MSGLVVLALDVLVDKMVLSLVVEDDMNFLGGVTADVGAEHNIVL